MNVALMGSVSSSFHALQALLRANIELTGVLGLDEALAESVADYRSLRGTALKAGLPFQSFRRVSEPAVFDFLRGHAPDLLWVIGLSQLVSPDLLHIARHGGVGFHPTILPRGRGRAPVAWTILLGERAAVNVFFLSEIADAGDIIVQREVPVLPDDYAQDLIDRTNAVLEETIVELAPRIQAGDLPRSPQDHGKATYYPRRTAVDGLIDWTRSTDSIYRLIRASSRPYPGAFSFCESGRVTIWRARPAKREDMLSSDSNRLGVIVGVDAQNRPLVATADGGLWLTETEIDRNPASPVPALQPGSRFQSTRAEDAAKSIQA